MDTLDTIEAMTMYPAAHLDEMPRGEATYCPEGSVINCVVAHCTTGIKGYSHLHWLGRLLREPRGSNRNRAYSHTFTWGEDIDLEFPPPLTFRVLRAIHYLTWYRSAWGQYVWFPEAEDDIHKGLDMRDTDHKTFLSCYQTAIGASIPAVELPIGVKCFEVLFVVEHYREDVEKHQRIPPGTTSQSGSTYSPMNTLTELVLPHGPESLLGTEFSTSAHHSQGEIVDAESIMEWDNWLLSSVDDIEWNEN
ncbi:hypothetical protein EYZ11_011665 [Aspergillus tanneri]|uniref:Uncharacterized protein n=1 Tax=Aspergillus tanneri TaxID=1220188 RepID=A0A4S3J4C6_9EURO|nr:hypothetical protein EYZ11_011665 [Aspergillus tanneri]